MAVPSVIQRQHSGMSFHHLDAPEYQGPGVTQLHDSAIEAELVAAPDRAVPDDVLHYNQQLQLDEDKRKKQLQRRRDDDHDSEQDNSDEEDDEPMQRMRERWLSQLQQQHATLKAAVTTQPDSSILRDITEDEFEHHCLTSSHSHLTLLLLHCLTPACLHMSAVLASFGRLYPSAVRCVRLRATGDNIARFPLAACPTVLAYTAGSKVGQWGERDWRRMGGGQVEVRDVVRELRRCGLLEGAAEDEEAEVDKRSDRLRLTRGTFGAAGGRRRGRDSSDDDDEDG